MKNKNIIAIEISTELCSLLIKYKKNIFKKYIFNKKRNNQYILNLINNIIKKNKIKINKINYFIINKGPGSIIGIRISYIIAKIFLIKYPKIKIIKISTFQIIINNLKYKKKKKKYIIIIYNSINDINICIIKKNKKKFINFKCFKIFIIKINKINNNYIIIVNNYKLYKKIKNIFIKKIKIYYPKAKYMINT